VQLGVFRADKPLRLDLRLDRRGSNARFSFADYSFAAAGAVLGDLRQAATASRSSSGNSSLELRIGQRPDFTSACRLRFAFLVVLLGP